MITASETSNTSDTSLQDNEISACAQTLILNEVNLTTVDDNISFDNFMADMIQRFQEADSRDHLVSITEKVLCNYLINEELTQEALETYRRSLFISDNSQSFWAGIQYTVQAELGKLKPSDEVLEAFIIGAVDHSDSSIDSADIIKKIRVTVEIIKIMRKVEPAMVIHTIDITTNYYKVHNSLLNVLEGILIMLDSSLDSSCDETSIPKLDSMQECMKRMILSYMLTNPPLDTSYGSEAGSSFLSIISGVYRSISELVFYHVNKDAKNYNSVISRIRQLGRNAFSTMSRAKWYAKNLERFSAGELGNVIRVSPVELGTLFLIDIIFMAVTAAEKLGGSNDVSISDRILRGRLAAQSFFKEDVVSVSLYFVSIAMAIMCLSTWNSDNLIQAYCIEELKKCSFADVSAALEFEEIYLFLSIITFIVNMPAAYKAIVGQGSDGYFMVDPYTKEHKNMARCQVIVAAVLLYSAALSRFEALDSDSLTVTLFSLLFTSMVGSVVAGIVEQAVFHNGLMKYLNDLLYTASGSRFYDNHIANGSSNACRHFLGRAVVALLFLFPVYAGSVISTNNFRMLFRDGFDVDVVETEPNQLELVGNPRPVSLRGA